MDSSPKKLYRSTTDRVFAGVCGGLGEYFELDPIIFRGIFLLMLLPGGFGIIFYLFMALLIPKNPQGAGAQAAAANFAQGVKDNMQELAEEVKTQEGWLSHRRNILGLIIVMLGLAVLLNQIFPQHWVRWEFLWPVFLIIIGTSILSRDKKG